MPGVRPKATPISVGTIDNHSSPRVQSARETFSESDKQQSTKETVPAKERLEKTTPEDRKNLDAAESRPVNTLPPKSPKDNSGSAREIFSNISDRSLQFCTRVLCT